jgi:hypothetical protein
MEEPEVLAHPAARTAPSSGLGQVVAIFTAIVATLAAVCSDLGGHTQNESLYYKNDAVLNRTLASDQWAYSQSKSIKAAVLEAQQEASQEPNLREHLQTEIDHYHADMSAIRSKAEALDHAAEQANTRAEQALHPHEKLALAITLFQIAISTASITALTQRRWLLGAAFVGAAGASALWVLAYL